jgi:putative ABC transport system ATP-binding protein
MTREAPTATVLDVSGVTKGFTTPAGTTQVLAGVDLTLQAGEVVAVAGRSGSGKTLLLTIIAGWEDADGGTVTFPQANGSGRQWRDLALLPQSLGLLDELTVDENIRLPRRLDRSNGQTGSQTSGEAGPAVDAADPGELMARLGIDHLAGRYPNQVSRGEQQRVALARAAVLSPRLLIADEPISHQNEGWAEAVMAVIADLSATGTACLLATHNALAFRSAHRVLHLTDGRLSTDPPALPEVASAHDPHTH